MNNNNLIVMRTKLESKRKYITLNTLWPSLFKVPRSVSKFKISASESCEPKIFT